MRILFVDDEALRHERANRAFAGHEVTHAYTVDAARHKVLTKAFEVICLDHDMADDGTSGADVARSIVARVAGGGWAPKFVWVHTWNPVGRQRIEGILAGYVRHGSAMFTEQSAESVARMLRGWEES